MGPGIRVLRVINRCAIPAVVEVPREGIFLVKFN